MKWLTKNILLLSWVSLFTDKASEMLYPIMPLFLENVGYTALGIGLLEGIAEAFAGISKGYFGAISDSKSSKVPFVRIGYGISAVSKPLMALLPNPITIFILRCTDRLGKGIRTAPRDAILAQESLPENRTKVFGFHRAMDTVGAVFGPLIALLFLIHTPTSIQLISVKK